MSFSPPALIAAEHQVDSFDCGKEPLNNYLRRFALANTAAGIARTYVTTRPENNLWSAITHWRLAQSRRLSFLSGSQKEFPTTPFQWCCWLDWPSIGAFITMGLE